MILNEHHVDAIDPLLKEYDALSHFDRRVYPHVAFTESKLEDFYKQNEYDMVFCLNAINHVENLQQAITNLSDSLKNDGILYLSVDVHRYSILKYLLQIVPADILHPHQLLLKDYISALEKENLKVERVVKIKSAGIFDYHLIAAKNVKEQSAPYPAN
jgi:2-polyprenyl-6-hydroxyphenyl methylase/3-demethylubiquinone-9 3-methyltransferase